MTLTTKLIAGTVIGVCLLAAGATLWTHYSGLVDAKAEQAKRITALEGDVSREKARADVAERAILAWDRAADRQVKALGELTQAQREAGRYTQEVKDVLSKHDLGALALRKPGLVEDRVNAGTARALSVLESASAPPARAAPASRPGTAGAAGP